MSYIGIDYGTRRVGVAVSDEGNRLAFPAEVVPRKEALRHIVELVKEREAKAIVIGESKNFQGEENAVNAEIKQFAHELEEKTGIDVVFEPEFLTSAAAKSAGASQEMTDASAAAFILQSFLDKQPDAQLHKKEDKSESESSSGSPAMASDQSPAIDIDLFKKLDIRIGEIVSAEKVAGADKLLRLEVSFGAEKRQIISGIAAYFPDPQALIGKRAAFAYNLAPRTIRGLESRGMILAAMDEAGNFSLLETHEVKAGASVR